MSYEDILNQSKLCWRYAAVNSNGELYLYDHMPKMDSTLEKWVADGGNCVHIPSELFDFESNVDWQNSLIERNLGLKLCPFCGEKAVIQEDNGLYRVVCSCDNDDAEGSIEVSTCWFVSKDKAIEVWNKRSFEDSLHNKIANLKSALIKAKEYLKKVDCYVEPVADEADYFAKVKIDEILNEV